MRGPQHAFSPSSAAVNNQELHVSVNLGKIVRSVKDVPSCIRSSTGDGLSDPPDAHPIGIQLSGRTRDLHAMASRNR